MSEAGLPTGQAGGDIPAELPPLTPGPPLVIVLSGPSGIGKDSVRELLMKWRLPLHFAVTATTRPPRAGEIEGVDYRFLSDAEFDRLEASDELIEHAIVYGQKKGVPRSEIVEPLDAGKDVIARVDVQGAATLRRLFPNAVLIFIAPPSPDEVQRRLEGRDTEPEDERRARLEAASAEMEAAKDFDYVVVNATGELEKTARRVVEIISTEKARRASTG